MADHAICAEIEYDGIHSDICPPGGNLDEVDEPLGVGPVETYRTFLHGCLDEWLDKSNGKGIFYIKDATTERPTR
jgi:hypothetical protein